MELHAVMNISVLNVNFKTVAYIAVALINSLGTYSWLSSRSHKHVLLVLGAFSPQETKATKYLHIRHIEVFIPLLWFLNLMDKFCL